MLSCGEVTVGRRQLRKRSMALLLGQLVGGPGQTHHRWVVQNIEPSDQEGIMGSLRLHLAGAAYGMEAAVHGGSLRFASA